MGDLLCTLNFDQADISSKTGANEKKASIPVATSTELSIDDVTICDQTAIQDTELVSPQRKTDGQINQDVEFVSPQRINLNEHHTMDSFVSPQRTNQNEQYAIDSQNKSTPRSVLTSPDAREIEMANLLLELGNQPGTPTTPVNIDAEKNNLVMVSTGASSVEIPTHDIARNANDSDSDDSEKTVDYNHQDHPVVNVDNESTHRSRNPESELQLPKGDLRYKHYGIRRQSPVSSTTTVNLRCYYCSENEVFHSKRELNKHHRTTHTTVQCPDCPRVFPTPDALQRHQYVHNKEHQFKCKLCDKVVGFKSDLDMHMSVHNDEKMWQCPYDDCNREFKRKSDLTAHEITHTGEDFICEFAGCSYKNKDP